MRDLTALRFTVSTALCALLLVGIAIFSGASQATSTSPISHVVIVIVDGLRPDAIFEARAPNLQALTRRGAYCVRARTVVPAATLPAHVSMLTGLGPTRHAVRFNTYPGHYYPEATLFSIAKKAGLTTAFLFAKRKLTFLADPRHLDVVYGPVPGSLDETRVTAARLSAVFDERWSQHQYNLAVVHIREPDDAGHHYGWMSRPYLEAVAVADQAVGAVLTTLTRTGRFAKTAIIITADHGGSGYGHRALKPENWTIPWIVVAPGVVPGLQIDRVVHIYDTTPTVLALLRVPAPPDNEGDVIAEVIP